MPDEANPIMPFHVDTVCGTGISALPPYLAVPPETVSVSDARQLFVDDYLIDHTDLTRIYYPAKPYAENPVLTPQTAVECDNGICPVAGPFNDGVWFDPDDGMYKLWYHAGWFGGTALALSRDGIAWERPQLDVVPGTNLVLPLNRRRMRDGSTVWLDTGARSPDERWKMFLFEREVDDRNHVLREHGSVLSSADGIHWTFRGNTGPCGDNTGFYFDPFRNRWIFSIRGFSKDWKRMRCIVERDDFFDCRWTTEEPAPWLWCDEQDRPDPVIGFVPQLYDFNAAAYESILIGVFGVMRGPENNVCEANGIPKTIDLELGFSRDGVHWFRPSTGRPFLRSSRIAGRWDRGYLHAAGGIWVDAGDHIRFYYSGWSGISPRLSGSANGGHFAANAMYAGAGTGFATLRRDGFAALCDYSGNGTVTTRPLVLSGCELYVNYICPGGALKVEVLDAAGNVIPGYGADEAVILDGDELSARVLWRANNRLPEHLSPLRFRFHVYRGALYSFRCGNTALS
ncbi:MAG: hypothetical protein HZC28_04190 [Spirochaetes bacterium]|nr:hypothetical protein [Spirochaetota bacterium]